MKSSAGAGFCLNDDTTAQVLDLFMDNREPESASRYIGDDGAGRNPGLKGEGGSLSFIQMLRLVGGNNTQLTGRLFHQGDVKAGAVISDEHFNGTTVFLGARYRDGSLRRFVLAYAHRRWLETVVDAVTYEVNERVFHLFEDVAIHLKLAPLNYHFQVFALLPCQLARKSREDVQQ